MCKTEKGSERKPIEDEIQDLQRKFRVLENDKRSYSEDSQGTIRKQRSTIEKLSRENRKMKGELNELRQSAVTHGVESKMTTDRLAKVTDEKESLRDKLDAEKE